MEDNINWRELFGYLYTKEPKAFQMENRGIKTLDIHSREEVAKAKDLEIMKVLSSIWGVLDIAWKGLELGHKIESKYLEMSLVGQEQAPTLGLLVDFGKVVEMRSAGLGNYKVGGGDCNKQ